MIQLDRRDKLTVTILSLTFFVIASLNLGSMDIPNSSWRVSEKDSFIIDLGSPKNVSKLWLLIKRGDINLDVFSDHRGTWIHKAKVSMNGYYNWKRIEIDAFSRLMKLDFESTYGEIVEIVLTDRGRIVEIESIKSIVSLEEEFTKLVDEGGKFELPPTSMYEAIFDEVYFVRAAEDYLSGSEPFESTHPQLGKLIIAAGISVFGYNTFGWRIMGVVLSSLMIPLIYLLGKELVSTWLGGFISALLLVFDFMHFTMGRMATVDNFLVFFTLVSQYFFYKYLKNVIGNGWKSSLSPLFTAVVFFSLGFSTKWIALFGFAGQIFLLFSLRSGRFFRNQVRNIELDIEKNGFLLAIIAGSVAIVVTIYFLCYIPYIAIGHSLRDVYDRQWYMLGYHSGLSISHPYSSSWWSWPLMIRPVWLYFSDLSEGLFSTISAMGNPAIWWVGSIAMLLSAETMIKKKDLSSTFLVTIFLFQWLPYALISRCLFLYHFYSNVPIFCLAIASIINKVWNGRKGKLIATIYLILVVLLFVLYYPVSSGHPINNHWRQLLRLLHSWMF